MLLHLLWIDRYYSVSIGTEPNLPIPKTSVPSFFRNRLVHISQESNLHRYRRTESIGSVFIECLGLGKGTRLAVMVSRRRVERWGINT
jgi:hypothetical protein